MSDCKFVDKKLLNDPIFIYISKVLQIYKQKYYFGICPCIVHFIKRSSGIINLNPNVCVSSRFLILFCRVLPCFLSCLFRERVTITYFTYDIVYTELVFNQV